MKAGQQVIATPKNGDFEHEFLGTIMGELERTKENAHYFLVQDQDDDVFCCELDQLSIVECSQ